MNKIVMLFPVLMAFGLGACVVEQDQPPSGPSENDTVRDLPPPLPWTDRTSGTTASLHAVATNDSLLVAVGDQGVILTSPNGVQWTERQSGTTLALRGVAWAGDRFLAVGDGGTLLESPDAATWLPIVSGTAHTLHAVAGNSENSVVVGDSGTVLFSADSGGWKAIEVVSADWWWMYSSDFPFLSAIWTGDHFVIGGEMGLLLWSSDGASWEAILGPYHSMAPENDAWLGLAWDGSGVLAVGIFGQCVRRITHGCTNYGYFGSSRHLTGASFQSPGNYTVYDVLGGLRSVAWNGKAFLAVQGTYYALSPNGNTWVSHADGPDLNSVAWYADVWVGVGAGGGIFTSP